MLVPTSPDWANCMDDVSCFKVASGGDDGIADGTTTDALTFFINLGATFGVDSAIRAIALVQTPMCGSHNSISILNRNIASNETQCCLPDFSLHQQVCNKRLKDINP